MGHHLAMRSEYAWSKYKKRGSELSEMLQHAVFAAFFDSFRFPVEVIEMGLKFKEELDGTIVCRSPVDELIQFVYEVKSTGRKAYDFPRSDRDRMHRHIRKVLVRSRTDIKEPRVQGCVIVAHAFTKACEDAAQRMSAQFVNIHLMPTSVLKAFSRTAAIFKMTRPGILRYFNPTYMFDRPGLVTTDNIRRLVGQASQDFYGNTLTEDIKNQILTELEDGISGADGI